jgi:hypothetical protein
LARNVLKSERQASVQKSPSKRAKTPGTKKVKNETEERFCPICFFIVTRMDYKEHFRTVHPKLPYQEPFVGQQNACPKCDAVAKTWRALNRHLVMKHNLGDRGLLFTIKCTQCEEMLMTKDALDSHLHLVHGAEKKFSCEVCGLKFSNMGSLKTHTYEKHPKDGQQRVGSCGSKFSVHDFSWHEMFPIFGLQIDKNSRSGYGSWRVQFMLGGVQQGW